MTWSLLLGLFLFVGIGLYWHQTTPTFDSAWAACLQSDETQARRLISARLYDASFREPRFVLEAAILVRRGLAKEAAGKLQQLGPAWRERPEVRRVWAEILYALGELREAESLFLSLLRDDPSQSHVHLWLGVVYYDEMQFDRFFREMERSLLLAPTDYRPHRLMGLAYHRFDRYSESARHFQEALRLGGISNQRDIVGHLAQALLLNRDYAAVVELISKIPDPTGEMWAILGEAHLNLGSGEELVNRCVENALKYGPHERRVLQFASQVFIESGRTEEAVEFLNEILKTAPHYQRAHYLLSRAYLKMGRQADYESSVQRLKVADEIKKEHGDLMQRILKRPNDEVALKRAEELAKEMGEPGLARMYAIARTSGAARKTQTP